MNCKNQIMTKQHAVISADIIASSSLSKESKSLLDKDLGAIMELLSKNYLTFTRILKGDYIECYVPKTWQSLRVALLLKTFIKMKVAHYEYNPDNINEYKYLKMYGIRLAIGLGNLLRLDLKKEIIDGEAIYFSGRLISEQQTHNKQKIIIKNSLFFKSKNEQLNENLIPLFALLDHVLAECTGKQAEVIFHKLLGKDEKEIAKELGISQSAINQQSNVAGWNAIEKAVIYYENLITTDNGSN